MTRATARIGLDERRRRLALRHRLAAEAKAASATDAARGVVVLHATDPASVFLQAWSRMHDAVIAGIERELYEERSLVRMLAMRRTLFVVPREIVPIVQSAASRSVARDQRRRLARFLEEHGIAPDGEAWLADVLPATVRALGELGEAVSTEISAAEPRLREQMLLSPGKRWEARQSVAVPALTVLSAEGLIVRGRPRGSWISSQYRWTTAERWLGAPIPEVQIERARAELVRLWLRSFGPATVNDIRWWTGWPLRDVRRSLEALDIAAVDMDGVAGVVLADDLGPTQPVAPWLAFLPALDPTTMGWQERDWYLGPHRPVLFDRNGNAGPTIWLDGRIVGGWTQRKDGTIAYRLLEDVGREVTIDTDAEAERLCSWMGETRFTMRFPSPLSRELGE